MSNQLERENAELSALNKMWAERLKFELDENARLRNALRELVEQCKTGDDVTAWWKVAVERAESVLLPNAAVTDADRRSV